jgi:hypothetical protein
MFNHYFESISLTTMFNHYFKSLNLTINLKALGLTKVINF